MNKILKKVLSIIFCAAIILTTMPFGVLEKLNFSNELEIEAEAAYYSSGNIIEFGSYPQTEVTSSALLKELDSLPLSWASFGYYATPNGDGIIGEYGKMRPSDFMQYADVEYDGERYRAVTFSQCRQICTTIYEGWDFITRASQIYGSVDTVYWFKFEPIKWRVLDPATGLLLCETVIDAQPYLNFLSKEDEDSYISYNSSSIKSWLNDDFYYTAFTPEERSVLLKSSIGKVFLLSADEVSDRNYFYNNEARMADVSNYAQCNGSDEAFWMLRTVTHEENAGVAPHSVNVDGELYDGVGLFWDNSCWIKNAETEEFFKVETEGYYDQSYIYYIKTLNGGELKKVEAVDYDNKLLIGYVDDETTGLLKRVEAELLGAEYLNVAIEDSCCLWGIRPAVKVNFYSEEFNKIINKSMDEITVNVKAVDEDSGELVDVDGATVEIVLNGKTIIDKKSEDGVVTFTREEISNKGHDISNVIKSAKVTAYKSVGNEMYVTNLDDYLRGESNIEITLDKLQFRPTISVGYNNGVVTYNEVKRTLDAYVKKLYYLTRGSIWVSVSNISAYTSDHLLYFSNHDILIGNRFETNAYTNGYGKSRNFIRVGIKDTGLTSNILCHESLHYFIGARDEYCCASKYTDNKNQYALDFNGNGKIEDYPYVIYWAESENYVLPKSKTMESDTYLSMKWESFRSTLFFYNIDIGEISSPNGNLYWINWEDYSEDYSIIEGAGEDIYKRKSIMNDFSELKATYWNKVYPRPSNFGIMDEGYALHLSTYLDYSYLNSIENKTVHSYTPQWYYNYKPVENQLEDFIESKATSNKYEASVLLGAMDLSHSELQLDTDYVHEEIEEEITVDENSALLDGASINYSPICFVSFDKSSTGTTVNLSSSDSSDIILLVKYSDNPTLERIDAVFENGAATIEIPDANGTIEYFYVLSENEDGTYSYNQLIYETFGEATSDGSYSSTVMTVSTASDNSANLAIYSEENSYANGEYFSVTNAFTAVELSDVEIADTFTQTVSYSENIDFTSLTAFMFDGENYTEIETYVGGGENNCAYVSFQYSGEGKYILMAKAPAETVYEAPTNLLIDDIDTTYEKEIHVSFDDSNDINDIAAYNLYYSASEITDTNAEGVTSISLKPSSESYTLYLNDDYGNYYFYVEAIGNDGGKSPLSEADYFSLAPYDSDFDGIPDYWLDWYPALSELEDIPGTDSDEDGLINIEEYENGTNPLNPDTDGDNVYDYAELLNSLNPLETMTDGLTDDYIAAYDVPDVFIDATSFVIGEDTVTCKIRNDADGKAMRTSIYLYVDGEIVDAATVNIAETSSVNYTFSKEYFVEGMKLILDEEQVTRDSDYSNNEFTYLPAAQITAVNPTVSLLPKESVQLEYILEPENASDIVTWKSDNESSVQVSDLGVVTGVVLGKATVTATSSQGITACFEVEVSDYPNVGDFEYYITDETVTITGYIGEDTDVSIPPTIEGYPVTDITRAFSGNTSVTSVEIPDNVSFIEIEAFSGCSALESVKLPENLTEISSEAFFECVSLKSFEIPDSVIRIGSGAFSGCTSLETVTIGKGVEQIGNKCFYKCSNLKTIYFNATNCTFVGTATIMLTKKIGPFYGCDSVEEIVIGNNVTNIPDYLFADLTSITSVNIPFNVTNIGAYAFLRCTDLDNIMFLSKTASIDASAFNNCGSVCIKCFENSTAHAFAVENDIDYVLIDGIQLSKTSATIKRGETLQLSAIVEEGYGGVTWSSSSSVATVDSSGLVKGVKQGTATITATNIFGKKVSCRVKVVSNTPTITIYNFNHSYEQKLDLWESYSSAKMKLGFYSYNCDDAVRFEWKSSNRRVRIDEDGNITNTGYFGRSSTITITAYDAEDKVVAKNSVKVSFYKFKWQRDRLQTQSIVSDGYIDHDVLEQALDKTTENEVIAILGCFIEYMEKIFKTLMFLK